MPRFAYAARGADGKSVSGSISAKSSEEAASKLRQKGLSVTELEEKPAFDLAALAAGSVKTQDLVLFTRTFVTMLEAGLPIVQALDILRDQQTNKLFKNALQSIKDSVEQGATLADSMRRQPKVFDDLYCNLVEAGEAGGVLDTVLNRLTVFLEKQAKIVKEVKGAMTYPIISLIIAFVCVATMLVKVIPTFEKMFHDMGRELPGLTVAVINLSHWMQDNLWTVLGSIAAF
ncbi:MAG: type II secretion system F family protein, partial [Candidatus Dadabacteria bacterium]